MNSIPETTDRAPSTRFPSIGWAWPKGDLDSLLFSAIHPDHSAALACFEGWLKRNDINDVTFSEHRLLAAIALRFGKGLSKHPEYPRLVGLQRMLWTKSRMAIREALPALKSMIDDGINIVLFKGASRIAIDADSQKGRVAHDIDVLLPASQFSNALDLLWNAGWLSASGESRLCIQHRAQGIPAMNFFKGHFGDIDLHQKAYPPSHIDDWADQEFWAGIIPAQFFDLPVSVPQPEERIALSVAHGGMDAHAHSDWLVDCAATIRHGAVDWTQFLKIVQARDLSLQAHIALSYLNLRLGVVIPVETLHALSENNGRGSLGYISTLLQAKPRNDWGIISWTGRGIAKQVRQENARRSGGDEERQVRWKGRVRRVKTGESGPETKCQHNLEFMPVSEPTNLKCRVEVAVDLPPVRRRLEFEINTNNQHIARLRSRILSKKGGRVKIEFKGTIDLRSEDEKLSIEARPSKQLHEGEAGNEQQKYGALPFQLLRFSLY